MSAAARPLRAIIVDDSSDDAELVARAVRRDGMKLDFEWVNEPRRYRELLAESGWDLVLCDYSMPEWNALEALRITKEIQPDLPFLVVSGTVGEETAVEVMKAGADDYFLKGNLTRLAPAVERAAMAGEARRVRKEMAQALSASEIRYRSLVENLNEGLCLVDADNRIVFVNRILSDMLGYREEEMRGRHLVDVMVDAWESGLRELIEGGAGSAREPHRTRLKAKDGGEIWAVLGVGLLKGEAGSRSGAIITAANVTGWVKSEKEKESLQDQLRQAAKMEAVGNLAGAVAHDLNNMLTPILGLSEIVLARLRKGHPSREDVKQIREAAVRAGVLSRQLLAFGRKQVLVMAAVDLELLISSTGKLLRSLIRENIAYSVDLAAGRAGAAINADVAQIQQALINLIVNAQDAMPDGGMLRVAVGRETKEATDRHFHGAFAPGKYVVVSVSDTGTGMDQRCVDRLFEPFFTTKPEGKGTGLGLASVLGIVRQHGGFVCVDTAPGKGTTFRLFFPATGKPLPPGDAHGRVASLRKGRETVLVVDDQPAIGRMVSRILEGNGYRSLRAESAKEALDLARSAPVPVDLLLTDVVLTGMNGKELAERLAGVFPRVKVLFVSGQAHDVIGGMGVAEGGVDFLQKPFASRDLLAKVRSVLDARPGPGSGSASARTRGTRSRPNFRKKIPGGR